MSGQDPRIIQELEQIDAAWNDLQAAFDDLTDDQLATPGVTGDWSVKDILAHVTTWEEETMANIAKLAAGRPIAWYDERAGGVDAFNAEASAASASLTLDEARRQMKETHARLPALVPTIPPGLLDGRSEVATRLREDTWGHYPEHAAAIRAWRERRAG